MFVSELVSVDGLVPQGSTGPLFGSVLLATGQEARAVVKFPTVEKAVFPEAVLNEWATNCLARIANIQSPPCYLVSASPEFVKTISTRYGLTISTPIGFASILSDIDPILLPTQVNAFPFQGVLSTFILDLLTVNSDRTISNPNCGQQNGWPFLYDFGASLLAPGTKPEAFERFFFEPQFPSRAYSHLFWDEISGWSGDSRTLSLELTKLIRHILTCSASPAFGACLSFGSVYWPAHSDLIAQYFSFLRDSEDLLIKRIVDYFWEN